MSTTPEVSKDHPRTLRRVSDGAVARVTDLAEYQSLTMTQGYRDITDEPDTTQKRSRSSSGSSSSSEPAAAPGS